MSSKKIFFIHTLLTGLLVITSVINLANAKDIAIYRWVDSNNVVHFSQNLPLGQEYTELSTVSSFKSLSKAERQTITEEGKVIKAAENRENQQQADIDKNKALYEKNCKAARLNIKMLKSLDNIHVNEEKEDGTIGSRPLTSAEKADKLALSKKHEGLYCSK